MFALDEHDRPTEISEDEAPESPVSPVSDEETEQEASDVAPDSDDGPDTPEDADAPVDEPAGDFRFKSHEEAERGYKNLQSEFTRRSQEAAEMRRRLEALENERTQAEQFRVSTDKLREYVADRYAKYLDDMDRLDPDDPNYRKLAGQLKADYDVDRMTYERSLSAEIGTANAERRTETAGSFGWDDVTAKAKAAGIEGDDPVFIGFTQKVSAFDAAGNPRSLEAQVEDAIQMTRKHYQSIEARVKQKQQPMGRSSGVKPARTTPEEAKRGLTTAEIMERVRDSRKAPARRH